MKLVIVASVSLWIAVSTIAYKTLKSEFNVRIIIDLEKASVVKLVSILHV